MLRRLVLLLLLLPLACIDPYNVNAPEGERYLTVEGYITTDPGPHSIKLTRTDTYGSAFEGLIRPIVQATVAVRDSDGLVSFLTEITQGVYETPANFRAKVGMSYTLQIDLSNGQSYSSLPELVKAVPKIDSVSYRSVSVATDNRLLDRFGVQLTTHFKDPGEESNFYYWRTGPATFVVVANPELFTLSPNHPTNPRGAAPKDCCAICYYKEQLRVQNFAIGTDEDFNGLSTRKQVTFIEDDGLRFKDTYRAEVQQMAISDNAYRFLKLAEQQLSITGSVFDQPPANIRGNMINLADPDEVVLGYFIAADIETKQIYIKRADLDQGLLQTPSIIPDDCRTFIGADITIPSDWNPK